MKSSVRVNLPLDPEISDFQEIMAATTSFLVAFLERLPSSPASNQDGLDAFLDDGAARRPPGEVGRTLKDVFEVVGRAGEIGFDTAGGGYLAYIPGSGLVTSAIADLISGVLNRYTGVSAAAPGLVALELDVLRWLTGLMGLPANASGILTSGASMATLSALLCARAAHLPEDFRAGTLYTTDQAHHCVAKAARLAGFPRDAVRQVAVDRDLRMDMAALKDAIQADRRGGRQPFCVVANAGTTNTGTVDPLHAIADLARAERLWFHVDAAYGGFFQLTERGRRRLDGIERADSVVLDPHKGLFLPFGTGCLLVRNGDILRHAHAGEEAAYLQDLAATDLVDFCHVSPELTRPNRGLRLWLPLQLHGVAAFRDALDLKLDLAEAAYRALRGISRLDVVVPPDLSIIAFRCRLPHGTAADENRATDDMVTQINGQRRVFLSTTLIGGRVVARIAILNHRTTAGHIEATVQAIRDYVASLP